MKIKSDLSTKTALSVAIFGAISLTSADVYSSSTINSLLEEVVVTARKRAAAESLQDVPVSASVFGSSQMEAVFAENLADLGDLSPNVEVENAGTRAGVANVFIRGMGLSGSVPTDEPTAGLVQDGVFWGVNYGGLLDSYDLESVEILRGPQGTLFGRNVTAGAFNVRSARPSGDFGFGGKITAGSYGRSDFAGYLEAPILEDKLAVRVAVQDKNRSGYIRNNSLGGESGESESRMLRGVLKYTPSDELDLTLIAEKYSNEGDGGVTFQLSDSDRKKFTTNQGDEGLTDGDVNFYALEVNYDLGHGTLTSVTGYRAVDARDRVDIDAMSADIFSQSAALDQDQFSQEIRYASEFSDNYRFTVGAYYFKQSWDYVEQRNPVVNVNTQAKLDHNSKGVFADVDINLSDALTLNLGGRYTREEKTARTAAFGAAATPGFCDPNADVVMDCIFGPQDSEQWTNFSPKVSLSYQAAENVLLFGTATRGFRSGGFAMRGSPLTTPYDEEIVDAFELGVKADFLDDRLRVNAAIYYNTYDDLQRTVVDPVTLLQTTLNAAAATIAGAELELTAQLLDNLVLNLNYGYTDASYDSYDNFDIDGDGTVDPEAKDLEFGRVPDQQIMLALTHEQEVADWGVLVSRISYSHTAEMKLDDGNFIDSPSFEDVSASVRFLSEDDKWGVALFGKNLTDEEHFTWGLNVLGGIAWGGTPRTWGVELSYNY
ncbi:TonB-dependent receptor [Pseudomaricurvus alkylphenolicus]|uniref:TonB-dependent receptor n=1 Tax=Pseudomaricurvus alkylphenolicus TaxID=1306991 RepID=UPI001422B7D8|nr:TonB-dependent receptor [Pseudomaricurvus alkylphenolicus]NIB40665.1 TonB-dependent receptor [Pseudomaricurvus alkylphenolicus]